jgi:glutamate 5-kinase
MHTKSSLRQITITVKVGTSLIDSEEGDRHATLGPIVEYCATDESGQEVVLSLGAAGVGRRRPNETSTPHDRRSWLLSVNLISCGYAAISSPYKIQVAQSF